MDSLEAGLGSGADSRASSAGGGGWREPFGELWGQAHLENSAGLGDLASVGMKAGHQVDVVQRGLLAVWGRSGGASPRSVLRYAVMALQCSVEVWRAFGPAGGQRQVHLLRRLEDTLTATDREVRAGEMALFVNRARISSAASAARSAVDDLMDAIVDPAEALAALEDTVIDLASLTVRVAMNLTEIGSARRTPTAQPAALRRQLNVLAAEVSSTAQVERSLRGNGEQEVHLGVWLGATLNIAHPTEAIAMASLRGADVSLRADALFSLRARWLELAVGLWVIVQTLDELLVIRSFANEDQLKSLASSRAGSVLVATRLCRRPFDFEHRQAWTRQREALHALVSDVCLALQTCEPDAVVRAQQLALRRLARALAAIWTIDERVRSPLGQANHHRP